MPKKIKFVMLNENAVLPTKGTVKSAGLDLASCVDIVIPGFAAENGVGQQCVNTGLSVSIPKGYYGRIAPRSGFSFKKNTDIGAGVIDEDYTGELKVLVRNFSSLPIVINKGDKIAQLILEKIGNYEPVFVSLLKKTERGDNGFGSTDKK